MNSLKKISRIVFGSFSVFLLGILLIAPVQLTYAKGGKENKTPSAPVVVSLPPIAVIEPTPATSTPSKQEHSHEITVATSTPQVLASTTPETDASTTPNNFKTGHVTISVRDGSVLAWTGTVAFPVGTSTMQVTPTNSSSSVPVLKQSLLGTLLRVEKTESDFTITDLEYYPSYGEFFINCVSVPAANANPDCSNWQYQVDGAYPFSSIDQYQLQDGDQIFLYFGNQQQVNLATSTVAVGESFVATAESYVPQTNTFAPIPNTVIGVTQPDPNNPYSPIEIATSTSDENGNATFTINTVGSYGVGLQADGYFPLTPLTVSTSTGGNGGGGGGGGGGGATGNVPSAFGFLTAHQNGDGSFANPIISDWSALALALPDAPSSARASLAHYLTTTQMPLSVPTDYERHAMALEALGINPFTGGPQDVITPIVQAYNGTSVGDPGIDNPDIFALIALEHAGYSGSDATMQGIESFVLSKQKPDGSWDEIPDLTSAAIQALIPLSNSSGAISKAESFLHSAQQPDGGFSNPDSTSWTLNALAALGQSPSSWTIGTNNPLTSLASDQQSDGGIGPTSENTDSRTWSTAYALTAFEGRSWSSLLGNYGGSGGTGTGNGGATNNGSATSTEATSTPIIATTILPIITPLITPLTPATTTLHYLKKKTLPTKKAVFTISTSTIAEAINNRSLGAGVAGAPAAGSFWSGLTEMFLAIGSFLKHLF